MPNDKTPSDEVRFGFIDSRTLPPKEQARIARERAGKMAQYAGDRVVAVYPIDHGGVGDWERFEPYLMEAGVRIERCPEGFMEQSGKQYAIGRTTGYDRHTGEYRIITESPKRLVVPDTQIALLFDDMVATGKSYIGGVAFMLLNQRTFGFQELWTSCVKDLFGVVRWPIIEIEHDVDYEGDWTSFLKDRMPGTHEAFEKEGLLEFLKVR